MKYVASCSGGKDSTTSLILIKEHNEPLDMVVYCEVMFDNKISGEHPIHSNFIYHTLKPWVEKELKVPFIVLHGQKTYLDCFNHTIVRGPNKGKTHGFAIPGMCLINRDCKIPPITKFWKDIGTEIIQYVGIASDESKRLKRLIGTNKLSLLDKYGVTELEALRLCKTYGLRSPIYDISNRNGCWFCPNCKDNEWIYLIENYPELFNKLICLEQTTKNIYRRCLTRNETPSELKARLIK